MSSSCKKALKIITYDAKLVANLCHKSEEKPRACVMQDTVIIDTRIDTLDPQKINIPLLKVNLAKASNDELLVLNTIMNMDVEEDVIVEFLKGGHLVIQDNGEFYKKFTEECQKLTNRSNKSSHKSDAPQYSLEGPFVKECLFGTRTVDGQTCTWIQLERHTTKPRDLFGHMSDYFKYVVSKMNQGPYGCSPYTEAKPLFIQAECVINTLEFDGQFEAQRFSFAP